MHLAAPHIECDAVERQRAPEPFGQVRDGERRRVGHSTPQSALKPEMKVSPYPSL